MTTARQPKVLLVEDEPQLRSASSEHLRSAGCHVLEAPSADQALAVLDQHHDIDIVFTDVNMPGAIDGVALGREVLRRRPHVPVILTSAAWAPDSGDIPDGALFVQKPYSIDAVVRLLRALIWAT
jgi:CheY-like chemotaxis protein